MYKKNASFCFFKGAAFFSLFINFCFLIGSTSFISFFMFQVNLFFGFAMFFVHFLPCSFLDFISPTFDPITCHNYGDFPALNRSFNAFFLAIRSCFSFSAAASAAAFSSIATCLAFFATSSAISSADFVLFAIR